VITTEFEERSEDTLKEIFDKIKEHPTEYPPSLSNLLSYFVGNNSKTYISTYHQPNISGVLTSRPLNITLKNMKTFTVYFIDHLCIQNESNTSRDIESELFQTHEYNIRNKNKKIKISLFKRKTKIPGLVELTTCTTYILPISNITKYTNLHPSMKLIEINKLNLNLLTTFIFNKKNNFDCFALPDITNFISFITNDTYKIYSIIENNKFISCYFYSEKYVVYTLYNIINLIAYISDCKNEIYINGFIKAILK